MPTKTIAWRYLPRRFSSAQAPGSYHITHTYLLGGDGSWDYVVPDPPNHHLFIARDPRHGRRRKYWNGRG
jgi:hypothetical protein